MSKRSAQRHRQERREREGEKRLETMEVKALDAVEEIVERATKPGESRQPRFTESKGGIFSSVFRWALSSMASEPSSRASVREWDRWFRITVQNEPFLAGVFNGAVQIDVNRGWTLTGGRNQVARYTKVLNSFDRYIKVGSQYVEGNTGGWRAYSSWQAQSYYATRMGFVSELGMAGRNGPLFTMWSVDPTRCELTNNPAAPLKYYPPTSGAQEWGYDAYIRKCSLISTDESALGYGFPAVERCYNLAKIMVGVLSHYMQKLGTKTPDGILTGKYIGEEQWETALTARNEALLANPSNYLNSIATIMNSGGDMPEFVLTTLSSLPDRWDIDLWTKILMRGYESAFGYKGEFTYENAGVLGRGNEVEVQHRNATAMGGKDYILAHQGELQRTLPPTLEFTYDERDINGDTEEAQLSLAKAQVVTEMTKWVVNTQSVLTSDQIMALAAEQALIPDNWTPTNEDVSATDEDAPDSERVYRACVMFPDEPIVRYSWPSGKTRTLYKYGADRLIPYFVFRSSAERTAPISPKQIDTAPTPVQPTTFNISPPSVSVQPHISVTVPEQHAAPINITVPERAVNVSVPERAISVNVPQQAAPVVNITTDPPNVKVDAPIIHVNVPEQQRLDPPIVNVNVPQQERQAPPVVNVSVPQQPAPVVNIAPPDVTVTIPDIKLQAGSIAKVKRDYTGKITEITSNAQVSGEA